MDEDKEELADTVKVACIGGGIKMGQDCGGIFV